MPALEVIADCGVCLGDVLSAPILMQTYKKTSRKVSACFYFIKNLEIPASGS